MEHPEYVLTAFGAAGSELEELLCYNQRTFSQPTDYEESSTAEAAHVSVWEEYEARGRLEGFCSVLKEALVQFHFPIRAGISDTEVYRAAARRGIHPVDSPEAAGLPLEKPDTLSIRLFASPVGRIPMLCVPHRPDFETILQALRYRNEPHPIPASMGACMINRYNNWDRVRRYRKTWEREDPQASPLLWMEEFQKLAARRDLYQDTFLVISGGPYSGVPAAELGLNHEEWCSISMRLRQGHESVHYFTQRVFGSAANHLYDELLADYFGLVEAVGRYRSDWFLHCMGLDQYPKYREGGRLENYLGTPPLSARAFLLVQRLAKAAADNLQQFDDIWGDQYRDLPGKRRLLHGLAGLSLVELTSKEGCSLIHASLKRSGYGAFPREQ